MAQQKPTSTKVLSAFDFDVVTDVPPPPRIRPDGTTDRGAAPAKPEPETGPSSETRIQAALR